MNTQPATKAPPGWTTWTAALTGDQIQIEETLPTCAARLAMAVDVDRFADAETMPPAYRPRLPAVTYLQQGLLIVGDCYRVRALRGPAAKALDVASYSDWTEVPR